jgi:hypothetical protein
MTPQRFSRCGYAENNPVVRTDATGLHSLRFDGDSIILFGDANETVVSAPASSGYPGFMSPQFQAERNKGPIPEGRYYIIPSEISVVSGFWKLARQIRTGFADWGSGRARLHPFSSTVTFGRTDFFIHGGRRPGSIGCVDVGDKDLEIFNQLMDHKINVTLTVDYPGFPKSTQIPGTNQ